MPAHRPGAKRGHAVWCVRLGVRHVSNDAGSKNSLPSGNNYTWRWGLRGEQDLGGGLKAGFWLESLINGAARRDRPGRLGPALGSAQHALPCLAA